MGGTANPLPGGALAVVLVLLSLEGYGSCGRGEATSFVAGGNLRCATGVPTSAVVLRAA